MPSFTRGETTIVYEVHGSGPALLLLAPGGMRSALAMWARAPFNPIAEFSSDFQVIAMDQRNAGSSRAPISEADGWHTYASDQLALLDELGVERCHLLGGCIGGAFALALCERAPERVRSAVLQQPIGLSPTNRSLFYGLFDGWAAELREKGYEASGEAFAPFRERMYGGDFVFSVSREAVSACSVPLLVLRGNDEYHPADTSDEIVRFAPHAELVESWKTGEDVSRAVSRVRAFLRAH